MKKIYCFVLVCFIFLFLLGGSEVEAGTLFRLPFASNPGYSAWYDHNSSAGSKLRYECATNFAYDNHKGTDFAASLGTTVYAGAIGSLYYRVDGCPDGSLPDCGIGYGNHVRISHPSDGRVSIYAHLKYGTVVWPQSILCGGPVGQSGNSGNSTGPHLHFELWQNTGIGTRLDFYGGSCNSPSYWVNQNGGWPTTQCQ